MDGINESDAVSEALNYAIRIAGTTDQYADDRDTVAYAAHHWKLEFDVLWEAWKKRFTLK